MRAVSVAAILLLLGVDNRPPIHTQPFSVRNGTAVVAPGTKDETTFIFKIEGRSSSTDPLILESGSGPSCKAGSVILFELVRGPGTYSVGQSGWNTASPILIAPQGASLCVRGSGRGKVYFAQF